MADDLTLIAAPDEAQEAEGAREVAAARLARPMRAPRHEANPEPAVGSPQPLPNPFDEFSNPFDQFDGEGKEVSLKERMRLNAMHSFYRGSLAGSGRLAAMAHFVKTPDPEDTPEAVRKSRDAMRLEYQDIIADLARYDTLAPWSTPGEAVTALAGQFGGAALSPESFAGIAARGPTWLYRTVKAAAQNAAVMATVDPAVQALGMSAGTQKTYSPLQTVAAAGMGAVIGGGLHLGGELIESAAIRRMQRDLAVEDPQFRGAAEAATLEREAPPAAPPESVAPAPATEAAPVSSPGAASPITTEMIGAPVEAMPQHRVVAADGTSIEVAPVVVEASSLKTSADAGYDSALQPRDRERAASQTQIREIAANLDPERLGQSAEADRGAPIVGSDSMVESGNGRVLAVRDAYAQGGEAAQRYRDWLQGQGVDISQFREPVLVRQRLTELTPEQRQQFTLAANQSSTLSLSAPERALADARSIDVDMLGLIRNANDLGAVANRDFVRSFVSTLPPAERGMMATAEGGLSSEGLLRVRNAVLARAYGDASVLTRIAEATDDEVKSISNALISAGPEWAKLRADVQSGAVRADIDQTAALVEAVTRAADLRSRGQKLDSYLAQQDAFDRLSSQVEAFMRMFYDGKGKRAAASQRIADALRFYAEEGRKVATQEGLALGLPPVRPEDLQRIALEREHGGQAEAGSLFLRAGPDNGAGGTALSGEVRGRGAGEGGPGLGGASAGRDRQRAGGYQSDELAALSARQSGGKLPMERRRPEAGVARETVPGETEQGTALATVPEPPSPERDTAIRSLQQMSMDLAQALDIPLRQGRIMTPGALGVFKSGQGVIRVREVPDFEVVAHEAGHAIEAKAGAELTALTDAFGSELRPLVSNPAAYAPEKHVQEGFAEFIRRYIGNPAWAEMNAPGFTKAFLDYMGRNQPDMLRAINEASKAYRAYLDAPSVDAIGAVVRSVDEEPRGVLGRALAAVREEGFPSVTRAVLTKMRDALFDEYAPVNRAVRDMARAIKAQTGQTVELKAAENPEVLARLLPRAQQMALGDMMDGVRPYHSVNPEGPSLSAALEVATGGKNSGGWGKFDPVKKADFSTYLVARRAEYLWRKFDEGKLPNAPVAFSKGDAVKAIADLERANETFRAASDMVHDYTRQLLRKSYDGGLIDADLYTKLVQEEFYVPFMRDMSDKPVSASGFGASAEGPGMTQVVKRMQGSSRDIKDPIESIMMQTFLVNRTLQHNDLIRSFVALAAKAGIAGGKYVERIPAKEARKYTYNMTDAIERLAKERGIDPDEARVFAASLGDLVGEDPVMGSFFRMEPTGKRGEPIVFYKDGGELRAARFMSENEGLPLYELLGSMPGKLTDVFSELVSATTTVVRTGIVTNPTFVLSNYIRDQFAVAILRGDYVPILSGLKGIKEEVTQGESARLYGIGGGVSPGSAIAPIERAVEADINALAKKGYAVNRFTSFRGFLEAAQVTEAGTRNSVFGKVFRAKRAEGLSDYESMIEAAFQATDILDFSRHGSHTEAVRRYVPFINAHIQGLDKAYRTMVRPLLDKMKGDQVFVRDSAEFKNALASWVKVFGVGGVLGAGWAAINRESEAYRDASPRVKGTHVVIPWGNKVALVPKPFELGIGFTLGEYAYQQTAQNDPRAAEQFAEAAWDVIAPPNPITDIPVIRTPIELKTGVSLFTGRPIVPETIARRSPAEQYTERTSTLAKFLGRQLNLSPIKIDYAIGSAFGTWGRDVMAMSSGLDQDTPAANWDDSIFLRRFIKDPTRSSTVTTKFWDYMGQSTGKFNQAVAAYDNLVKSFDEDGAVRFMAKLPTNERAFVVLKSAADEDGKPAFNADQKRLHPLTRAYDAVTILNQMRRDLSQNTFRTFEEGARQKLDPKTRRDLIDNIRELAQLEMRNALVIMKEPGYANRPLFSTETTMEKIKALSPEVAGEIATRYATSKIYTTAAVAAAYPQMKDALIKEGSEADISSLAFEAQAEGYEFGGERVKRPAKRRLYIAPTQPALQ